MKSILECLCPLLEWVSSLGVGKSLTRATTLGNIYSPQEAILAGYLDECVPSANWNSMPSSAEAYSRIKTLPFVTTKKNERRDVLKACRDGLETDVKMFS